ncbi:LysR family transcriptional regulator [Rudaeicoccus suwonensis]|uniref:DNA-binding transcriptional LysR family regulator n=1 Tax=Rudaeicoccus suwonensis TaxID=657409 RepID=A0A561E3S6_9MICO|nr:LysR substrate-binding domain-containing protein [Rudaeicoccus suwonensis]TWE10266.1 DNA-binding transcriptional LysR family regulator [Rudaeicoccus suwonensis]
MSDLDLRKLRYFLAIVDGGTFSRAAETLHIAQPVLSRQLRSLEKELGAILFERSSRGTELTAAGTALVDDARGLLASSVAFQRRARVHGRGEARFTIAFMPGVIVTGMARELSARFSGTRVEVLRSSWEDQVEVVRDGRADVSIVRLPVPRRGLRVVPMASEPRLVALPVGHPLARRPALRVADLVDLELLQDVDAVPEWRDAAERLRVNGLADRPIDLPMPTTVEEKLEYVAAGVGIAILPESAANFYTRPDVAYCRVTDLAPSDIALVCEVGRKSEIIDAAIELALDTAGVVVGDAG